jgi:MoaA/NifB/PqqE/SkfB family radical SAM enzyme
MRKTVSFSRNSTNIFFHILTKCNLKCRHCYINRDQHGKNTLPLKTIERWLGLFSRKSNNANLIFLGGEPTLHPDLYLAVKKANELGFKSVTIDTNGYLFNDILLKLEPDEIDYFSFSLDGATRETNDMIRGQGSYDKCIENIKQASSMGFNTSLIYTVSKDNIDELETIPPLLNDLGINRFFIQILGTRGRAAKEREKKGSMDKQVSPEMWRNLIPEVADKIACLNIIVTYPKVYLNPGEPFECAGVLANNYFIFPNGRVYRCPLCEDFPIHSMVLKNDRLYETKKINESHLFQLNIPEGCVMNKLVQPENLVYKNKKNPKYKPERKPEYKIACCLLKEEVDCK